MDNDDKEVIDQRAIESEREVLSFLLKDTKYISAIFSKKKVPIEYFRDPDIRIIVDFILQYFGKYDSIIVEEEFLKFVDGLLMRKKIDSIKHVNIMGVFDFVAGPFGIKHKLEDEQFNRIVDTWINIETTPEVKKVLDKGLEAIQSGRGLEAITNITTGLNRIHHPEKINDYIDTFSLVRDVERQIKDAEDRRFNKEENTGIPVYIEEVDEIFSGFEKGTLSAIGGLVGHGKSTFMLNFSRNQFLHGKRVLIISMEVPALQWTRRLNCSTTGVDYTGILTGSELLVPDPDFNKYKNGIINRAKGDDNYNILFAPAEAHTWPDIVKLIEEKYEFYNPDIIYIDQLSLINLSNYGNQNRRDVALGELTKDIRSYAQINKIPIVVAVQANRASVIRDSKGERKIDINIENIEDSNKIAAHLDNFLAIWKSSDTSAMIKIVKQREGESGEKTITLLVDWKCGMIRSSKMSPVDMKSIEMINVEDQLMNLEEEDEDEERSKSVDSLMEIITEGIGNEEEDDGPEEDNLDAAQDSLENPEDKEDIKEVSNPKTANKSKQILKCTDLNLMEKVKSIGRKSLSAVSKARMDSI